MRAQPESTVMQRNRERIILLFWYKSLFTDTSKAPRNGRDFVNKRTLLLSCFLYLFNASTRLFWFLSFAQSRKKCSKLSAIMTHRGTNFVMMASIVRLSSNRS